MPPMVRRAAAARATMERFQGRPFAWGSVDCAKMAAFHLRQMGHHQSLGLAKAGTYRSALGARRALARAGYGSVTAAIDALGFGRIPPAAALVGDLVELPGADEISAIAVALGGGRILGFHEDVDGAEVLVPVAICKAWRIS